ncbi:MAG: GEVED domain-containing protein [Saprospiraceae bacterium]
MRFSVQKLLAVWVLTFSFAFTAYNQDDLSLSVSTTSGTVDVGDIGIQFTVTVSNEGATEINDVEVTMSVPAGLTLTGTSVGGSYTPGTGVWDIGTISAGTASVTMIMTFDVTGEGVHTLSGNITNMDVIDGDSDPTDNSVLEDDYGASCVTAPYEYCAGETIDITATAPAGHNSYQWKLNGADIPGETNQTYNIVAPGNYSYTVNVGATGSCASGSCCDIIVIENALPTASISNSPNVTVIDCTNTSIDLTASGGGTYAWSDGTNSLGTNATITVTAAGTYTVTVTSAEGCTDTEAVTITEDTTPPTASISNNPNVTVIDCTNTSIDLTASGGGTYAWSDGTNNLGTNATITVTAAGTYTVTVTAANGCTDTEAVTITEDTTPPTASISNNPNVTVIDCTNTSIDLTASGGGTYAWSDGTNNLGTNATITVTAAGTYTVTVTAANGCTDTEAVTITEDTTPPSAAITNNDATTEITCLQTSISLTATGGVGYSWAATGGGTIAGATNVATISATSAGTYTVTVTGINGCTATAQEVLTGSCTVDYADLPDGTAGNGPGDYNTTLANNGPSHGIIAGLTLGTNIDAESDGQPSANGDGDDTDVDGDDDDGVTIGSTFDVVPGGTIRLPYDGTNSTGNDANLVAWVDWDNDGVFEAGEQVTPIVVPGTGAFSGYLTIPVPEGAATGTNIGVLVRLSNSPITSPDGYLSSGEVESYMLTVNCPTQICLPATSVKN